MIGELVDYLFVCYYLVVELVDCVVDIGVIEWCLDFDDY